MVAESSENGGPQSYTHKELNSANNKNEPEWGPWAPGENAYTLGSALQFPTIVSILQTFNHKIVLPFLIVSFFFFFADSEP